MRKATYGRQRGQLLEEGSPHWMRIMKVTEEGGDRHPDPDVEVEDEGVEKGERKG